MFKRLLISYLALIGFTVLVLGVVVHVFTSQTFSQYLVNQAEVHGKMLPVMLSGYYTRNGSWEGIQQNIAQAGAMLGEEVSFADQTGRVIASTNPGLIGKAVGDFNSMISTPVTGANGQNLGTAFIGRFSTQERIDEMFLQEVSRGFLWLAIGIAIVAALIGWFLARSISRPTVWMSQAAARMAKGDYSVRVDIAGSPELRSLGNSFNRMAQGLDQVEKMRRRLLADVSHDLRTPLTVLLGYLEGLRSDQIVDRQTAEIAFGAMDQEVRRLLRLVESLRQLSRVEALNRVNLRKSVSINKLVEEVIKRMNPIFRKKGIGIEKLIPDHIPDLLLEEESVGQALFNLLENASRYTSQGGRVTIRSGFDQEAVWVSVTDTGPGISEDQIPLIFERFYRGDQARSLTEESGSGIGLSIVQEVMEKHGGQVTVESEVGKGSTFVLHFPIVKEVA